MKQKHTGAGKKKLARRTPEDIRGALNYLFNTYGEDLSYLAWDGFLRCGRGMVQVSFAKVKQNGDQFAQYVSRAEVLKSLKSGADVVAARIDAYAPEKEVLFAIYFPATETDPGAWIPITYVPVIPPPAATANGFVVVPKYETGH